MTLNLATGDRLYDPIDTKTEDLDQLAAGYYHIYVRDMAGNLAEAEITLKEPGPDVDPAAPCATTSGPANWGYFTSPQMIYSCPSVFVSIGSYNLSPVARFNVTGNSYFNGRVGIAADPSLNNASTYKLIVGGKIAAREVVVSGLTPWPDYAFKMDYPLTSLNDVKDLDRKSVV